jgi:membrane dipeptidase
LLDRAKTLLEKAPLIDTHNDLPSMLLETKAGDLTSFDMSKVQPTLCADIPRLREGRVGAQYWSVFVESATQRTHTSLHEALREFDVALRFIHSRPELEQARTADDIDRIHRSERIACLLGVEGGHMIENSPAALRTFHELGARYMTLTHWDNIDWADSANGPTGTLRADGVRGARGEGNEPFGHVRGPLPRQPGHHAGHIARDARSRYLLALECLRH